MFMSLEHHTHTRGSDTQRISEKLLSLGYQLGQEGVKIINEIRSSYIADKSQDYKQRFTTHWQTALKILIPKYHKEHRHQNGQAWFVFFVKISISIIIYAALLVIQPSISLANLSLLLCSLFSIVCFSKSNNRLFDIISTKAQNDAKILLEAAPEESSEPVTFNPRSIEFVPKLTRSDSCNSLSSGQTDRESLTTTPLTTPENSPGRPGKEHKPAYEDDKKSFSKDWENDSALPDPPRLVK